MNMDVIIVSASSISLKVILFLIFLVVIIAGPLVYRILIGEKFGWFKDPNNRRPNKDQWDQLRDKADRIIGGTLEVEGKELCELIGEMKYELEVHERNKGTIEYENDCQRIEQLYKKLEGMDLRIEPFDSLVEYLEKDGLTEQARKLHDMMHLTCTKSMYQFKKELRAELVKIRNESWDILRPETKTALKESIKSLKDNSIITVCVGGVVLLGGLALRFYHSIVQEKGYEFYKEHPAWLLAFAILIGVPCVILVIKFIAWKNSFREKPDWQFDK